MNPIGGGEAADSDSGSRYVIMYVITHVCVDMALGGVGLCE